MTDRSVAVRRCRYSHHSDPAGRPEAAGYPRSDPAGPGFVAGFAVPAVVFPVPVSFAQAGLYWLSHQHVPDPALIPHRNGQWRHPASPVAPVHCPGCTRHLYCLSGKMHPVPAHNYRTHKLLHLAIPQI